MSDFTVYKPRNGQILKKGRVMSASDLAVELTQLQATNERLTAERDEEKQLRESNQWFNIDVVRCLSVLAWKHNHEDIPQYMELAKRLIKKFEKRGVIQETRDLEQQAKGIADARHLYSINTFEGRRCWSSALYSYAETLRQQAKEKDSE